MICCGLIVQIVSAIHRLHRCMILLLSGMLSVLCFRVLLFAVTEQISAVLLLVQAYMHDNAKSTCRLE